MVEQTLYTIKGTKGQALVKSASLTDCAHMRAIGGLCPLNALVPLRPSLASGIFNILYGRA